MPGSDPTRAAQTMQERNAEHARGAESVPLPPVAAIFARMAFGSIFLRVVAECARTTPGAGPRRSSELVNRGRGPRVPVQEGQVGCDLHLHGGPALMVQDVFQTRGHGVPLSSGLAAPPRPTEQHRATPATHGRPQRRPAAVGVTARPYPAAPRRPSRPTPQGEKHSLPTHPP